MSLTGPRELDNSHALTKRGDGSIPEEECAEFLAWVRAGLPRWDWGHRAIANAWRRHRYSYNGRLGRFELSVQSITPRAGSHAWKSDHALWNARLLRSADPINRGAVYFLRCETQWSPYNALWHLVEWVKAIGPMLGEAAALDAWGDDEG